MRKSGGGWRTFLFLLAGMVIGSVLGDILGTSLHVPYVNLGTPILWHPSGDVSVIKYDLQIQVRLNLLGLIGIGAGYWLSRKV